MGTGALRPERRDACVERRIQDFSKSVTARYDHITQQLYGAHGLAAARRIETMAVPHDGVRYEERGGRSNPRADKRRATRLLRELKALGYQVQATRLPAQAPA